MIIAGRRIALLDEVTAAKIPAWRPSSSMYRASTASSPPRANYSRTHPDLNLVFNNAGFMPFDDVSGPIDDAAAKDAPVPRRNIAGPRP
ncbi:hypothetical protein [Agrobacterium tumefaciens]|uniref:hypothetical protein n=1 Tax=Agrobacterium tumefaciens TaxID=358 RepID=UPI0009B9A47C